MKKSILILATALLFTLNSCKENPVQPVIDPTEPVADAGVNQTINVGSYFVFDASKSSKGTGKTLTITWGQDSNNPMKLILFSDSVFSIAATKEGIYKFNLVVNNGIKDSKPSELIITVKPKTNSLISDLVLEATIRIALNKQVSDLTDTDLLEIDSLKVSLSVQNTNNKVSDLHGIERCKNIKQLLLSLQSITDVSPLSSLTNLERLDIDQNHDLSDISALSTLTRLRHIDLANINITDISPLSNMLNLEYINIELTKVKDISVITNFKKLKEFWGTQLPITNLSLFSDLKDLDLLFLVFSQLDDISAIRNLTNLKQIEISENHISDITPLAQLHELITLRITDNHIKDISPLQGLSKLTDIWLSRNKIEDIKPLVDNTNLVNGTDIMLDGNPLNEKSINEYIPQLRARGIIVYWQ